MWIRTTNRIIFIEVKQTIQGFWIPKQGILYIPCYKTFIMKAHEFIEKNTDKNLHISDVMCQ